MDLSQKIKSTIIDNGLISKNKHVLIGVSGGADSIALLHVLNNLKNKIGFHILVAHFNHNVRSSAQDDESFVKNTATDLNIPFKSEISKTLRLKNGSFEERARNERLAFFLKTAKEYKCTHIALAHTKNDQSETVLMRLLKGTGLRGLQGILMSRTQDNVQIIRPFLNTEREEIEIFLRTKKIKWREDPTNKDSKILRNKIRHNLIPQLKKEYNPNINSVLSGLAQNSTQDYQFIEICAQKAMKKVITQKPPHTVVINTKAFLSQHASLQNLILQKCLLSLKSDHKPLASKHIGEILDLIANKPIKSIVHLPKGLKAQKFLTEIKITKS